MTRNGGWWIGIALSAVTALAGQAEVFSEPWRHLIATAGIVATGITAVNAKWPKGSPQRTARKRAHR